MEITIRREDTPLWKTTSSPGICNHLIVSSLWKINGVNLNSVVDKPTIVLSFQDDRPKKSRKRPFLDTKSAIERARRFVTARNLFVVVRVCSPVDLSLLDASFEARCRCKDFWILLLVACSSTLTQKRPFFTPNGPRQDTTVWKTTSSSPICTH